MDTDSSGTVTLQEAAELLVGNAKDSDKISKELMAGLSEEIRLKQLSKRSRNSQTPMMLNYEMKQTRQTLRKGNLFRTVKDDVLTKFVDMTNMMTFKRGSTIIKQG